MSEVISSAEFIRKKCKKDFEELVNLFKQPIKEFMRKRFNKTYKELFELFKNINVDRKDIEFKDEDIGVMFERFFKSFPSCMPSRYITPFRDLRRMK